MRRLLVALAMLIVAVSCSEGTESATTSTVAGSTTTASSTTSTKVTTLAPTYVTGAAGIGDDYYPSLGNGGYDVDHYHLDIAYDRDGTVAASVVVTATAVEDLASFNLDFIGWEIDRLVVNGVPTPYERRDGELTIAPVELRNGQVFETEVDYRGIPAPSASMAMPFGIGWSTGPEGEQFVVAEPDAARSWFPANDHPLDKATFTFSITVPEGFTGAANGELTGVADGNGDRTFDWSMDAPMAPYLATVVIGEDWAIVEDPVASADARIAIRNVLPPDLVAAPPAVLEATGEMLTVLESSFGPYPFTHYGIAVVGGFPAALENQTLSVFGRAMVESPYFEYVLVHELAHQWFGDSVSVGKWSDVWLNEGFATFAELLWIEEQYGPAAYREEVLNRMEAARVGEYGPPATPPPDDLFNSSVYQRGAFVLVALRDAVGDDVFFDILRSYAQRFADANATTEDFVALAEEKAGRDLDDLFDAWLYGQQLPG
jgi:aminopeptidase N